MPKKICCLLVVLIAAFACPVLASTYTEVQEAITPRFTHIMFVDSWLLISAMGEATCGGAAILYTPTQSIEITIELQRLEGSSWATVRTWTATGPGLPGVELERRHYVSSGVYRARTRARAFSSGGLLLEEASTYSGITAY